MSETESKDLALAPNEYAFCMDSQSGSIRTFSGPFNHSLSKTDQLVRFNSELKKFESVNWSNAKTVKHVAPEGWYISLKNPAKDPNKKHPTDGTASVMPDLEIGRKIIVPGPVSFSSWPGQMVRIIQGHHLRHNQYLIIRVYDEDTANANWDKQLLKTRKGEEVNTETTDKLNIDKPTDLRTGKLLVIRGDQVSFYMPTTGFEVVTAGFDGPNRIYVRDAVTLERLEYCLLIDQSGDKRYVQGPAVVFPQPTEEFYEKNNKDGVLVRKFKAYELTPNSGLYVKVIENYQDEYGTYKAGDELFITGKDTPIYFPRKEHSIIKYEDQDVHYGIMIPEGEARYVANRNTGVISIIKGPVLFLPDPRTEVIVRRVLDPSLCEVMYPGNNEALSHNISLQANTTEPFEAAVYSASVASAACAIDEDACLPLRSFNRRVKQATGNSTFGTELNRGNKYTPPRTLTLNAKYDGCVTIDVWDGYAVMLTSKGESGIRRVIVGPKTAMLEYHEIPHVVSLSTGKPKNTESLLNTIYLKINNNPVTDIVSVETKDYCKIEIKLAYRVSFTGEDFTSWFSIENYVKFLCDHMRSVLRGAVKKFTIREFYENASEIIRDLTLGKKLENGSRSGHVFDNNMVVADVEVLYISLDKEISDLLIGTQRRVVKQNLDLESKHREFSFISESEKIKRKLFAEENQTFREQKEFEKQSVALFTELAELKAKAAHQEASLQEKTILALEEIKDLTETIKRHRRIADADVQLSIDKQSSEIVANAQKAEADALTIKASAISDHLISALRGFGDAELVSKFAEALGPTQILKVVGGSDVKSIISGLLNGTPFADRVEQLITESAKDK